MLQHSALLLELADFLGRLQEDSSILCSLFLLELVHHGAVLQIDLSVHFYPHGVVLLLLGHVQVDRVVICREFVALEKLDGGLVKLEHHDFVQ